MLDSCYLENLTQGRKSVLSTTETNTYQYSKGEEYSILCEVEDGPVQSVVFTYDGQTHTERKVPYYMKGDWKGWINRVEYLQQCGKKDVKVTAKSNSMLCFEVKLELVARCDDKVSVAPIVTGAPTKPPMTITPTTFPTEQVTSSPSAPPTHRMTTQSPTRDSTDRPTATVTTIPPTVASTSSSPTFLATTFYPTSASTIAPTISKTPQPTVTATPPVPASTPPITKVTRSPTAIPVLETGAPTDQCANTGELCGVTPCGGTGLIWCCGDLVCRTSKTGFRCVEDCLLENWRCDKDDDCCGEMECRPVPNRRDERRCYTKTAAPVVLSPTAAPTSSPTTYCEEQFGVSSNDPRCPGGPDRSNRYCPLGLTCYYNGITWP